MTTFAQPDIGVYRIVHSASGRFYYGSSKNLERRFKQHINDLCTNRHHSRFLQACWNKYGAKAFVFEIVANCVSWDDALDIEQSFLDEFHRSSDCMNGSGRARMPILDPFVMARARASANASTKYQESHRAVCVARNADPDFQSRASEAMRSSAKHKAATQNNARTVLQRPDVIARNRFALANSAAQKAAAREQLSRLNADPESRARRLAKSSKPVVGVHVVSGESLSFPSQSAAARFLGVYSSNISECCRDQTKTSKGFRWSMP